MTERLSNYVNGEMVPPGGGTYLENREPATGCVYSEVPDSDGGDVDAAVTAACSAFLGWSETTASERSRMLMAIADGIESQLDRLAEAESRDSGKPLALARKVTCRSISLPGRLLRHWPPGTPWWENPPN
jgi:aminomuconate-semialdehyde/2-hydroxymuconate-6-semialdehyde dehydrogenase